MQVSTTKIAIPVVLVAVATVLYLAFSDVSLVQREHTSANSSLRNTQITTSEIDQEENEEPAMSFRDYQSLELVAPATETSTLGTFLEDYENAYLVNLETYESAYHPTDFVLRSFGENLLSPHVILIRSAFSDTESFDLFMEKRQIYEFRAVATTSENRLLVAGLVGKGGIQGSLFLYDLSERRFSDLGIPVRHIISVSPNGQKVITQANQSSTRGTETLVWYSVDDGSRHKLIELDEPHQTFEAQRIHGASHAITWLDEQLVEISIYDDSGSEPGEANDLLETRTFDLK